MPTTQELHVPHPPLEGAGFFQTEPTGVDTTVEQPELEGATASLEQEGKGRTKRKSRPSTEPE